MKRRFRRVHARTYRLDIRGHHRNPRSRLIPTRLTSEYIQAVTGHLGTSLPSFYFAGGANSLSARISQVWWSRPTPH